MLLSFIHNHQSLYVVDGPDLSTRLLQWWYGGYRQSSCAHSAITAPWVPLSLCSPAILILSASGLRTLCHYLFEPSAVRSFAASLLCLVNITLPSRKSPQMWHPWFSAERVCVCGWRLLHPRRTWGEDCGWIHALFCNSDSSCWLHIWAHQHVVINRGTIMAHVCIGWGFSKKELL